MGLGLSLAKIAIEEDGVLYHRSRLLEAAEIKAVGHLADSINLETFTGIGFKVPVIDQHSPLAISTSIYLHYVKYPHRGAETLHRLSMQHCNILKGRQIFSHISKDCDYCKKLRKKLAEQMMGPLDPSQTSIAPVFYFTLIDLWGPLPSFVPGYEKMTRSSASKPHDGLHDVLRMRSHRYGKLSSHLRKKKLFFVLMVETDFSLKLQFPKLLTPMNKVACCLDLPMVRLILLTCQMSSPDNVGSKCFRSL